jgi:hypothetical protein
MWTNGKKCGKGQGNPNFTIIPNGTRLSEASNPKKGGSPGRQRFAGMSIPVGLERGFPDRNLKKFETGVHQHFKD